LEILETNCRDNYSPTPSLFVVAQTAEFAATAEFIGAAPAGFDRSQP